MGLFSRIFGGKSKVKSVASGTSFLGAYREASGKDANWGGWGLDRFNSIVDAHSSVEDLVDMFEIYDEGSKYMSLDGYTNCYTQAWQEEYERASVEADILNMLLAPFGEEVEPEELMDYDKIEEDAYEYACELVEAWLDGGEWVPEEVMDFAWYGLSDHNY